LRFLLLTSLLAAPAYAQVLSASKILRGSGTDIARAIAVDPQGNVFVAGTTTSPDFPIVNGIMPHFPDAALRISTDGQTFTSASFPVPGITAMAASQDGRTLLAAAAAGIYRSVDAGATWSATPAGIYGSAVALAVDPTNPSNAYAVVNYNGLTYFDHSSDGGLNWQASGAQGPMQTTSLSRIFIDSQNPASIYAYFSNGLYHSANSGGSWQQVFISAPYGQATPTAFAIAPSRPQTLYAITNLGPPQKSVDGGATWQTIANMSTSNLNTFAVDPNNPDILWFTDSTGIKRSADGGASVQTVASIGNGTWQSLAIDPANSSHIFAAGWLGLYASLDNGATWSIVVERTLTGVLATPLAINAYGSAIPTAFLAKLDATLSRILFSTFIGPAQQNDMVLAVDAAGNPLISGLTLYPNILSEGPTATITNPFGFAVKVRSDGGAIVYSAFMAGFTPKGAAFDASGNAFIAGSALPGVAVSANALQSTVPGPCTRKPVGLNIIPPMQPGHAFVTKLKADDGTPLYATYLTGSCGDSANAVQLDAAGNAYIAGFTYSLDFPLTKNALVPSFPGDTTQTSAFVTELSADGSKLIYSSFFYGGELNSGNAIALDGLGNAYVGGSTQATASQGALAVANPNGCQRTINIGPSTDQSYEYVDGFVMKLRLDGTPPAFLATVGGSCQDNVQSLSLDAAGNIWVAGMTASADFPLVAPLAGLGLGQGQFVAEIDPAGSKLLFSSFTGGYNAFPPAVMATRSGAFVATAVTTLAKPAGAASALAAFVDTSQSPPIALNYLQPAAAAPAPQIAVFLPPATAPGELVILTGTGIGPSTAVIAQLTPGGLFPSTLAGVRVTFNGIPAPLISVAANRIECQSPYGLDGAATAVAQVQYNGQSSNLFAADMLAQQISLLAFTNADGTVNSTANPAKVGSAVTLYLTGLGQTVPPSVDGAINSGAPAAPRTAPVVYVNGSQVQPAFLGPAPGQSSGVFQLNVVLPQPQFGLNYDFISVSGSSGPYNATVQAYVQ
jgi:uncharacterized protein (TIGR03437 family)